MLHRYARRFGTTAALILLIVVAVLALWLNRS